MQLEQYFLVCEIHKVGRISYLELLHELHLVRLYRRGNFQLQPIINPIKSYLNTFNFERVLKNEDLPTFGNPTIPIFTLFPKKNNFLTNTWSSQYYMFFWFIILIFFRHFKAKIKLNESLMWFGPIVILATFQPINM